MGNRGFEQPIMIEGLIVSVFGPEYYGAESADLGVFEAPAGTSEIDIVDGYKTILPAAGYVIRYVAGEYTLVGFGGESKVGRESGLQVRWKTLNNEWVLVDFPNVPVGKHQFTAGWNVDDLLYCELTDPGRIQLVPPSDMYGTVSVRVIQSTPSYASISNQPQ